MIDQMKIAVIGLGYVGLPLAVALARHFNTTGFDIDQRRCAELRRGHDRTHEVSDEAMRSTTLKVSADEAAIAGADVFIITVPTPVDPQNRPDLHAVLSACATAGRAIRPGGIVVLESTVYPGVTETLCGPAVQRETNLVCGEDFFLGYSPERINPGDREHTVERIVKVVAGQTPAVTEVLAEVYGRVTEGGVFRAANIRTAEAAKVIENAQRDINIAFVNEIAQIFAKLGLSIHDVLAASATKWNFLSFQPGLVGGHCIGVDPFYLARCAEQIGHRAEVVLAGRRINDGMGAFIADQIAERLSHRLPPGRPARLLVLGLTFKENVPDLRNSKVVDVVNRLRQHGHQVSIHDPLADPEEARREYDVDLLPNLADVEPFDGVVAAVSHDQYRRFTTETLGLLVRPGGLVADIKGVWRSLEPPAGRGWWSL